MLKNQSLSAYESCSIFIILFLYHLFNNVLYDLDNQAGSAAWLAQIIGVCLSFGLLGLFMLLYNRYNGRSLLGIFDAVYGGFLGKLVALLLLGYLMLYCAVTLNQSTDILQVYSYSGMSGLQIEFLLMVSVFVFAIYPIKGMAKTVSIFVPVLLGAWTLILLLCCREYDIGLLSPVMGYGIRETAAAGVGLMSEFAGIVIIGVFGVSVGEGKDYRKPAIRAIIISGAVVIATTLCYNMSVPYGSARYMPPGVLGIAQIAYGSRLLQKLEAVFIAVCISAVILMMGVGFLAVKKTYCHIFSIKQKHAGAVILPLGALIICLSRTMGTNQALKTALSGFVRRAGGVACAALILVTLLVSLIRRQGRKGYRISAALLLICFATAPLGGCAVAIEPDAEMYPLIIGYDKGENEAYTLTMKFMTHDGGNSGSAKESPDGENGAGKEDGGPGEMPGDMIVLEAPGFIEGMNLINAVMPKHVSFLHVKMLVISEEIAREGIDSLISEVLRFSQIKPTMAVVVSECPAYDFIEAQKSAMTDSLQMDLELILDPDKTTNAYMVVGMSQLLHSYKSSYGDAMAILGNTNQRDSGSQDAEEAPDKRVADTRLRFEDGYLAGHTPVMGNSSMELAGMAAFSGDRMSGTLDTRDCQTLAFLSGEHKRGFIGIPDMLEPDKYTVTLDLRRTRPIKYDVWLDGDGTANIVITVRLGAQLAAGISNDGRPNYADDAAMKAELAEYIERTMEQRGAELIQKLQQELDSDVLQLGRRVAGSFPTIPEWESYNWSERYASARIRVDFQIKL